MALTEQYTSPTIDTLHVQEPVQNPYELTSEDVQAKTNMLFYNYEPFISHATHPDIDEDLYVFAVDGTDPWSDVARSVEGKVYQTDWGQTPEQSLVDLAPYEANSAFFILVRKDMKNEDDMPEAIGALRVAISTQPGMPLESRTFYHREAAHLHEDGVVPGNVDAELDIKDSERKIWDVVGVAVNRDHRRNNHSSAWLYHALYAMSQIDGVDRWLANMHAKEQKNLHMLGIPFEQIPGSKVVTHEFPATEEKGPKVLEFYFSVCNPWAIRASMEKEIARLEYDGDDKKLSALGKFVASLARIALDGKKAH